MRNLLIFDGDCGFCTTVALWVEKRWRGRVAITPYQFANLSEFGLSVEQATSKVYLVSGEAKFAGHEVVAELIRLRRPKSLGWLAKLIVSKPLTPVSAWVYALIAKNRHKFPGGTPACQMPKE